MARRGVYGNYEKPNSGWPSVVYLLLSCRQDAGRTADEGAQTTAWSKMLDQFGQEMLDGCADINLIGVCNFCEPYILKHYASRNVAFCQLGGLPAKSKLPNQWTSVLAGK